MLEVRGVLPALVTPFTDDGKRVDETRLRGLVTHVIEKGATGVVPCGTTGEFQNLSMDERKRVAEIVIDEVNGRVPVIVGTGCSSTDLTIEMTKYAKDVGAQAALVVTPYYHKPANRGIYEHYRCVADAVDLPLILYNIPQVTGVPLAWQMVEDLADLPNIVGLKDSSGELKYILAVIEKTRPKLSVLCGHDEVVLPALASGCAGMILASANIMPDVWMQLYNAVKKNHLEKAQEIQLRFQKLCRIITKSGAVGVKAALNMMRINVGPVRLPLSVGGELSYEDREELRIELEKMGKIEPRIVTFEIVPGKPIEERYAAIGVTPQLMKDFQLRVGEALVGEETEVAHIDLMIGMKDGLLGQAFAKTKASPTPGHEPLVAILEPNLMVKPLTMIVPTVTIKNMRQASMVYGPAQAAVAKAVIDSVKDNSLPKDAVDNLIIITNVFVHPSAVSRKRIYINNYKAVRHAIRKAVESRPTLNELLENKERAKHPFKYTP